MKHSAIFILLSGLFLSCETDFNPIHQANPVPVVYALMDTEDSLARVRLSKSFTLENAFDQENIPSDSLVFPAAQVWLERWNGDYLYLRAELTRGNTTRVGGIFPANPNPVFSLPFNEQTARIFEPPNSNEDQDRLKLIIEIPGYPLVYSEIKPMAPAVFSAPREGTKINLYSVEGFKPRVNAGRDAHYVEGWVEVEYFDHFENSDSLRIIRWREYHADKSMQNPPPFQIFAEDFLRRISFYIKDDQKVRYRTFHRLWITLKGTDKHFYDYIQRSKVTPIDQSGQPYSNLVNGIGLFAATSSTKRWFELSYYMLSELSNSEYTKHLRFVSW